MRRRIIGVMGSGSRPEIANARALATVLAAFDADVLTGGGGGAMASICAAYAAEPGRRGRLIAVLPARSEADWASAPDGYPNPHVELVIRTHLPERGAAGAGPRGRNPINVLSSDAVILLPGGEGTLGELMLARRFRRPHLLFGMDLAAFAGFPSDTPRTDRPARVAAFLREVLAGV
ncbi:molybdenum cofactor carrier protein [bacterium]|nr:molybdenum cofactor carrier protein [bacterium]